MNFREKVLNQLSSYKANVLDITEKGLFKYQGELLKYEHILPEEKKRLNILPFYRDEFYQSEKSTIKFHKYFHHLNSSQALCINLFYPLIAESRMDLIVELLGLSELEINYTEFEFESDLEKTKGRKTNFDFYLKFLDSIRIYIELKYTEQKFGSAKNDQYYVDKYKETYLKLLRENQFIKEEFKTVDHFLKNYQIMRNLVHLGESDYVVFLYPEANRTIHRQANLAYNNLLTDEGKERFKLLSLAKVVDHIVDHISEDRLKKHFEEFNTKYLT